MANLLHKHELPNLQLISQKTTPQMPRGSRHPLQPIPGTCNGLKGRPLFHAEDQLNNYAVDCRVYCRTWRKEERCAISWTTMERTESSPHWNVTINEEEERWVSPVSRLQSERQTESTYNIINSHLDRDIHKWWLGCFALHKQRDSDGREFTLQ